MTDKDEAMTGNTDEPFVDPDVLRDKLARGEPVVIVDVRSAQEFLAGHVDGAVNIPSEQLSAQDATIVTVCNHGGQRSCGAAAELRAMGFENVSALRGGTHGWNKDS